MTNTTMPPRWAEVLLGLVLPAADVESVSGDLLEAYRDRLVPARGRAAADAWYVRQVAGFAWRAQWPWAVLLAAAVVARTALDWTVPTADFSGRSAVSTFGAFAIFAGAGFAAAWRTRDARAGVLAGLITSGLGAVLCAIGTTALLAVRHDAGTWQAIEASGGAGEAFTLPFLVMAPACVLAALGGVAGWMARRLLRGGRAAA